MLFVAFDEAGRCLVSIEEPVFDRRVDRVNHDGVVHISVPGGDGDEWTLSSPEVAGARLLTGGAFVVAAGVAITVSAVFTPWVGVPMGVAAVVYIGHRYVSGEAALTERWDQRHRMLRRGPEAEVFRRGFRAARIALTTWPQLRSLTRVDSPRQEIAGSLWALAGLLRDHAALREQVDSLERARLDLPAGVALHGELAERLAVVEASRLPVHAEIERRLAALETLAAECTRFVQDEETLRKAHEAVRQADRLLGRITPPVTTPPDGTRELAERTRAVIGAYRELQEGC
ncbi:hypothetical protein GCM10010399_33490 [Dactylosporangium fulvum]|uniref:Uncharacterized protein n=1 Tax=Dactylosporangium fulvum TaxID=53359 RepID=A0ABY5VXI1_9ACTN|nr:hypothetical protein [Dactylosporangium fulvum]UWP82508.1 hypothetical protein Dfulv_46975 [Dactylosporangium fulvum]